MSMSTARQPPPPTWIIRDLEQDEWKQDSAPAHGAILGSPRPMPEAINRLKSIAFDQYEVFYYPTYPKPCWGRYPFTWSFHVARRGMGPVEGIIVDWRKEFKITTQGIGPKWEDIGMMLLAGPSKRVKFEYSVRDSSTRAGMRKVERHLLFPCVPQESHIPLHHLTYYD